MIEIATSTLAFGTVGSLGGSLLYLLCGGGFLGAVVIFFVLRMIGSK